jgi:hypothetical protein
MSIESADNILHVKNSTMRISRVEVGQTFSVGNIEFDTTTTLASVTSNGNNTTPHTISSSNVTTGLATTANVVVGGDLIVGGTSLVNAIYPVGTVIDRATAITDTHPNGKYKAFLSAPEQEWELVSDGQDVVPLEYLTQLARTTSFCGRATLTPATAIQDLTESFADLTGTEVSGFVPVIGTKKIKYHVNFATRGVLGEFRIQFKEGSGIWQEIKNVSTSFYSGAGAGGNSTGSFDISCILTLNDIDDAVNGLLTSERPTLSMKVIGREYDQSANYYMSVHNNPYYFTTDGSVTNQDILRLPVVDIISLGPEANLKYKRTL